MNNETYGNDSVLNLIKIDSVYKRIKNSSHNKEDLLKTINSLVEMATVSQNEGLMSLEKYLYREPVHLFIKKAIFYITNMDGRGLKPQELYDTLSSYILISDIEGHELLNHLIMMQGMILINSGTVAIKLREILSMYIGVLELQLN